MAQLQIDTDEQVLRRLQCFQKVVQEILGEEMSFDTYLQLVILQGLEKMLRDVITADAEVLWVTVKGMAEENPEFVYQFITDALQRGADIVRRDEAQQWLGFVRER